MLALFLVVLLSRVPFLDHGYGEHADAWRVARTAKRWAETGVYEPSRVPGFPLHEALCALVWPWRAPGLNGLSAVASAAACVLFALYAKRRGCRDSIPAALALAGLPAFFVNSVSAKDFTLTLAALLGSALAAATGWPLLAGLALGAAAACRSVAAIYGLPLAILVLAAAPQKDRVRHFLRFFLVASAVAAACYLPILAKFGSVLFDVNSGLGYPPAATVLERGTLEVWGWPGLAALALMLAAPVVFRHRETALPALPRAEIFAWSLFVLLTAGFYAWLPDQAGYFIPALPFALLLLARVTPRRVFQTGCALCLVASFITISRTPLHAAILADRAARDTTLTQVRGFASFCKTMPGAGVIVAGAWEPLLAVLDLRASEHRFVYLLPPEEVRALAAEHRPIFFTPETRAFEAKIHGLDLAEFGGRDLRAAYLEQQTPAK